MFSKELYIKRRAELRARVGSGIILLPGNSESPANYPANGFRFRQDSTFLYFFGINQPDYVAILDVDSGIDTLFGDDYTIDDIIWMGTQPSLADQAAQVGVMHTAPFDALGSQIEKALKSGRKVHYLPPYRADIKILISSLMGIPTGELSAAVSVELALAVVALREIKDRYEIEQIEQACEIGYRMHTLAMQMCRPGVVEREIAGAIESAALQYGAGVSFHSIVSQNGETLHNHNHENTLQQGRLLLVDAGAESTMNYCSDFTRAIPVGGKFSARQADVYNVVLAANSRAFEFSKPGLCYRDVHIEAARVLTRGLMDLGLMQGNVDAAVEVGAQALFMPHGLGHQMGLDVHDMENIGEKYVGYDQETMRSSTPGLSSLRMGKRLKPGMVMTVEPGVYFIPALIAKWKNEGLGHGFINFAKAEQYLDFGGIRIEDDLLITDAGNRMLGKKRVPATVSEVETYMAEHPFNR